MMIIPATESHVPEIVEIWKEFMDFHSDIDPYFARNEEGHSKFDEWVKELMKSDTALVLVALDQGQVVAYSLSQINKRPPLFKKVDYGYIYDLAVKSEYRRKGIGEQMLGEILGWFKSRQVDRIELMVLAKNKVAFSFWEKQGFKVFLNRMYLPPES
ncbi:MAG: GNAT family N-acetyltransferase [Candidatus Zixiibacteriota bacterium]